MKKCTSCLLPETHETIKFNEEGSCNICTGIKFRDNEIDYSKKKIELDNLIAEYKGQGDYDCIIPFSGGKDSTWALYYLMTEYNIKPLVVRFDHGFLRPTLEENVKRCQRKLGFDMINFTPNWKITQKLMLRSFLDKGDFCWHCHTGIFSYPMWISVEKKIPLMFWGEKSSDYTNYYSYDEGEEHNEKRFNRFINLGITAEDMFIRLKGEVDKRELKPYSFPPLDSLKQIKSKSVMLGSYIKWNPKKQSEIISRELGWKGEEVENVPPEYNYEKIECYMQGVRDYIKYIKRGYSRPSHLSAIDLRNKEISKEKAQDNINLYEGKKPQSLKLFLDFVGMTEAEFYKVAISHTISPNEFKMKEDNGKKTKDFSKWSKDGVADRNETKKIIEEWSQDQ
tara:strand:- start:2326 stop:3510 length:1185 start_codon:yes stop_codon:yes gene_type:complete